MEFSIGKMLIKVSGLQERMMIVAPIGDHVIAVMIELFRLPPTPNSVNVSTDIYHKDDVMASGKVQRELEELGDDA